MKTVMFITLLIAVFVSALQVVIAQHEARKLFVEIQSQEKIRDDLNEEWTRLLLEQSTWATDARIESVARNQLDMRRPGSDTLLVIER